VLQLLPCFAVCCRVLPCVAAVCCRVLQRTTVCCSALHCQHKPYSSNSFRSDCSERLNVSCVRVTVCYSELQYVAVCAVCYNVLQCVAACYSVVQCVAVCCSVLQCVAVCCSVLQCVAVQGSIQCVFHTQQHTATHGNTFHTDIAGNISY